MRFDNLLKSLIKISLLIFSTGKKNLIKKQLLKFFNISKRLISTYFFNTILDLNFSVLNLGQVKVSSSKE
jgi:hypothetical protein